MSRLTRFQVSSLRLAACLVMALWLASGSSALFQPTAKAAPAALVWPSISLTSVVTGLSSPVFATHAGDGSGRLFIVQRAGLIRIYSSGALLPAPFLNLSSTGANKVRSIGSEEGLLSVAFPPGYPGTGKDHFYVYYTNLSGDEVIARYELTSANVANPNSEQIILTVSHPGQSNHNGGQLAFGPADGYLYIGPGDGGGSGDPGENGQDTTELLGKILRLDVETSSPVTYTIPASNPFVGVAGRDEIWALGLRNPWRFSFDRLTHDLYIADVGQGNIEEVNFQAAASAGGDNYGWDCYEGDNAFESAGCGPSGNYDFPVVTYNHAAGDCSVTGGYVYRGAQHPSMQGLYFYADYCTGKVWALQRDGSAWQSMQLLDSPYNISSFGEDEAGNLYLTHLGGTLYRIQSNSLIYADPAGACGGNTPCHTSLQAAINAATTGDAVSAYPGTYNESITLNQSIPVSLLAGPHDLNGSLTINAGTFTAPSGALSVSGNFTLGAGATFSHNSGTVVFDGSGAQSVSGSPAFFNVTVNAGAVVDTGAGAVAVSGTLTNNGAMQRTSSAQTVTTGGGTVNFTDPINKLSARVTSTGATSLGSTTVAITTHQSPAALGCGSFPAGVVPVLRHFNITPANTTGVAATLRLYYQPSNEANGNSPASLAIYHCSGGAWTRLTGSYFTGSDAGSGYNYLELSGITDFSPFAIGSPGVPTSAGLTAFSARPERALATLALAAGVILATLSGLAYWYRRNARLAKDSHG